jgi:hypothetical protein
MHLSDGEIRAFQDMELEAERLKLAETHLATCAACQVKAGAILSRTRAVKKRLSTLDIASSQSAMQVARTRLATRLGLTAKENNTMLKKLTTMLTRPVWATLVIVAILVTALCFPQVRALADSFLGLFRVEQIKVVQVNPGNLPERLGASSEFESMISKDVQFRERGDLHEVGSVAEASTLAGFPMRNLPAELTGKPTSLWVQPGATVIFNIDLELMRGVLKDLDLADISLPDNLDGATVELEIPDSAIARIGECKPVDLQSSDPDQPQTYAPKNCTILVQMPSPTISAPPDLDITLIGQAYLQLLGMTREEAASFARNVNWTTTFVIPIPRYGAEFEDVSVDGVTGSLIQRQAEGEYMLVWVKDGVIYALSGAGRATEALAIANSMK